MITELEIIEIKLFDILEGWECDFAIIELLLDKIALFIYHMNI
jgi:hypothetical protein